MQHRADRSRRTGGVSLGELEQGHIRFGHFPLGVLRT